MDENNELKIFVSMESLQSELIIGEENVINFDEKIKIKLNNVGICRDVLAKMANNSQSHDVTLIAGVDGVKIPANRSVLSSANDYFSAMFNAPMQEKTQKEVQIQEVNGETLKLLVGYCYSGEVEITSENLLDLLASAAPLNFIEIEKKCKQFLAKQLTSKPEIWLKIYHIAEKYAFNDLMDATIRIVCKDFESIAQTNDFHDMEFACLEQILKSNDINDVAEEKIFEAAMEWVNFAEDRKQFIPKILKMIRLAIIDETYLVVKISPICIANNCSDILIKTLQWHVLLEPLKNEYLPLEQTIERTWPIKMLAIGGNSKKNSICLESYCFRSKKWTISGHVELPDVKIERHFAVSDGIVYVINGSERELGPVVASQTVYRFDLRTLNLSTVTPMTTKRAYQNVAVIDKMLYVVGGFNGVYLNTMECYNPNTNEWTTCTQMPTARAYMGTAVLGDHLYVIGGYSTNGYLELVERYNPATNTWQAMNPMNVRRANAGIGVLNDQIYVLGGQNNNGDHLQSVEVYDQATTKWTMIAAVSTPCSGAAVAVYENHVFAIGGVNGSTRIASVERLNADQEESKWVKIDSLQCPRFNCAVTIVGDQ